MPKATTSITEGSYPADTKTDLVVALAEFTERVRRSQKKITYTKVELVEGELRWKLIEEG